MKRYLPVVLVVAGFVAGLGLLLLALDIARAERELQRDDTRFLAQPRVPGYWGSSGLLPLDLGRRVLGVRDDVERRRAVQLFWRAHPRDYTPPTPTRLAQRAQAQAALAEADAGGGGPAASQTAMLLGVLALLTPPEDAELTQVLNAAAAAFRRAIASDPTNEDAKHNLESVLWTGQRQSRGGGGGTSTSGSPREYGGAAASNRGSGY
jgi:hypothetical protein